MGGTREVWASTAIRCARSREVKEAVSRPATSTRPATGRKRPAANFTNVDFPQPLGPTMLVTAPAGMTAESPSMKGTPDL